MSYINVDKIMESLVEPLQFCLKDRDPYVCKSAAIAVAKLYMYDAPLVERLGLLSSLQNLINHENPTVKIGYRENYPCFISPNAENRKVVSNAVAALTEISDRSETFDLRFDLTIASKLMTAIEGCNE